MQINNVFNDFPSGVIIGGNCYFNQSAKPVTRPDGSALVTGDKWNNPSNGKTGFWNGTYWLGKLTVNQLVVNSGATGAIRFGTLERGSHLAVLMAYESNQNNDITADASNYWTVDIGFANTQGGYETVYFGGEQTLNFNIPAASYSAITLNQASYNPNLTGLRMGRFKVGNPSDLKLTYIIHTHIIL
jgi:hypothetical protein